MIIVKLMGGIGNQMFQYACGRRLSHIHDMDLLLDTRFLESRIHRENFTYRDFELDIFNINIQKCDYRTVKRFYSNNLYYRALRKFANPKILLEQGRKLNENILSAPSSVYLDGYWQSERYFTDISDIIRNEFRFPTKAENQYVSDLTRAITDSNSVSIHIRRGDYITNKIVMSVFGNLTMEYYQKGIEYLQHKIKNPIFYIFSNDPEYLQDKFKLKCDYILVEHSELTPNYVDLKLMSFCKHNIIANSSYSWWGAWLNSNPDKTVIAPENWYAKDNNMEVNAYRIPSGWKIF
jgi:hypothetical protein